MGGLPLLVGLSSTTSSCIKLAVWIISVISASLLCFSVMSLRNIYLSLERSGVMLQMKQSVLGKQADLGHERQAESHTRVDDKRSIVTSTLTLGLHILLLLSIP